MKPACPILVPSLSQACPPYSPIPPIGLGQTSRRGRQLRTLWAFASWQPRPLSQLGPTIERWHPGSGRPLSRGSSGVDLRTWASVLKVAAVRLCVKRLPAHPAWGLELPRYFVLLLRQLGIHRPFYEQYPTQRRAWGLPDG